MKESVSENRKALFEAMKNEILGKDYELSFAFINAEKIKKLNLIYRNKNEATDILSFPLSKTEGEIYICLSETRKKAKEFDRKFENFLSFLFIHGLVHLKGLDHSSTMERIEAKFRKKFGI